VEMCIQWLRLNIYREVSGESGGIPTPRVN